MRGIAKVVLVYASPFPANLWLVSHENTLVQGRRRAPKTKVRLGPQILSLMRPASWRQHVNEYDLLCSHQFLCFSNATAPNCARLTYFSAESILLH